MIEWLYDNVIDSAWRMALSVVVIVALPTVAIVVPIMIYDARSSARYTKSCEALGGTVDSIGGRYRICLSPDGRLIREAHS